MPESATRYSLALDQVALIAARRQTLRVAATDLSGGWVAAVLRATPGGCQLSGRRRAEPLGRLDRDQLHDGSEREH
jgi:hypothetical protein